MAQVLPQCSVFPTWPPQQELPGQPQLQASARNVSVCVCAAGSLGGLLEHCVESSCLITYEGLATCCCQPGLKVLCIFCQPIYSVLEEAMQATALTPAPAVALTKHLFNGCRFVCAVQRAWQCPISCLVPTGRPASTPEPSAFAVPARAFLGTLARPLWCVVTVDGTSLLCGATASLEASHVGVFACTQTGADLGAGCCFHGRRMCARDCHGANPMQQCRQRLCVHASDNVQRCALHSSVLLSRY